MERPPQSRLLLLTQRASLLTVLSAIRQETLRRFRKAPDRTPTSGLSPQAQIRQTQRFTLVFRASDRTNVASASSLYAAVHYRDTKYTRALITSVGANNAVNNSFDDASTNNHTITAYGNVTQNAFSPYRRGGYGHYFDGSGDYLSVGGSVIMRP